MKQSFTFFLCRSLLLTGLVFLCFFQEIKAKTIAFSGGNLQNVINNATSGDTIEFSADYYSSTSITISKAIVIDGAHFTLSNYSEVSCFIINTTQKVVINNLVFYCSGTNIDIQAAAIVEVNNNDFIGNVYAVFGGDAKYNFTAKGNLFDRSYLGLNNGKIINNTFIGDYYSFGVVFLSDGSSSEVYNNLFYGWADAVNINASYVSKVHHNSFFEYSEGTVQTYYTSNNNIIDDPDLNWENYTPLNPDFYTAGFNGTYIGYFNPNTASNVVADFSVDFNHTNLTATLTNKSSGYSTFYWMAWGDYYYDYSYDASPVFQFGEPGYYTISLYVYDENDYPAWKDTTFSIGNVNSIVKAAYDYSTEDWTNFVFSDNSGGNISSYLWTFGDGTYATTNVVNKTYDYSGIYNVCLTVTNTAGDMDEFCQDFWVGDVQCDLNSSFTYRKEADGKSVTFTNTSTGSFDYVYWDFNDGYISEDLSTTLKHTYDYEGYYEAYLYIYNTQSDCYSEAYAEIQIGEIECVADFDYTVNVDKLQVSFKNNSKSGEGLVYWYFDDGDYSEELNPLKTFDMGGLHTAGLVVWNADYSCVDYMEKEIQLGEINCSAKFTFTVDKTTKTVHCKNQAIGKNVEYLWYFGDGTYVEEKNPSHKFDFNGYYTIGLITYDATDWCMDYYEDVAIVGDPELDCEAAFTSIVNHDTRELTFSDQSKGRPVSYLWDFGDGKTSKEKSPKHVYNTGGYYNVCLSITNAKGVPNITCQQVYIKATENNNCNAEFVFSKKAKDAYFTDKSIGKPNKYSWDFGDGKAVGTVANPKHTYDTAGYYLVKLTISTESGCVSSTYKLVNIGKKDTLMVRFGYKGKPQRKAGGYPVDFVGAGSGDQARLRWDFGDSTSNTTTTTPSHEYQEKGTYNVCVTYEDPVTGAKSEYCQNVTTGATYVPEASVIENDLSVFPNPVDEEFTVSYSLKESGNVELSLFDLSGKKVTMLANAYQFAGCNIHNFDMKGFKAGNYMLLVKTENGSISKMIVKK